MRAVEPTTTPTTAELVSSGRRCSVPFQDHSTEQGGQRLRRVRERLDLRYRDVEKASLRIAEARGNPEFAIALSRLADIENKGTVPTIYRLYSLAAIYRLDFAEVLRWYGVDLTGLAGDATLAEVERTHLIGFQVPEELEVEAPLSLDPVADLRATTALSRLIQRWGRLPLAMLRHLDLKNHLYGLVGTEDWSMYPLIPPGSLVLIDETRRKVGDTGWASEFERPVYFLEHREGYACSWCHVSEGKLVLQPHPASKCNPKVYNYPEDIEVVGQVAGVAMRLTPARGRRSRL